MLRLFVCVALAGALFAESRTERGERVVKEALTALGGEKYLAMRDRLEQGRAYSFYRERLSGLAKTKVYTRYLTRPEPPPVAYLGVRVRQTMGKDEEAAVVFREDGQAWDITYRGARPMPESETLRFKEGQIRNVFYILRMRLGEPGLILEWTGSEVVDNAPAEVVDITDSENRVVTVWFHQSTKLPLRQRAFRRSGGERDEDMTFFSKYRDVGGVMWPYTWLRTRNGEKIFEMFSDLVEINSGLTDDLFTVSGDTKILKK